MVLPLPELITEAFQSIDEENCALQTQPLIVSISRKV